MTDVKAGKDAGASAVAIGSMAVFQNQNRSVLINFPKLVKDRDMEYKKSQLNINPGDILDEKKWRNYWSTSVQIKTKNVIYCKSVYHSEIPKIKFNSKGICNFCETHDDLNKMFPGGSQGKKDFQDICDQIKKDSKENKYDVIIGLSGGADFHT